MSKKYVKSFSNSYLIIPFTDVRKYSFTQRIVNIWNSLPEHVVNSSPVNSFKNNLDKFWVSQEVYYNFKAEAMVTPRRKCRRPAMVTPKSYPYQ